MRMPTAPAPPVEEEEDAPGIRTMRIGAGLVQRRCPGCEEELEQPGTPDVQTKSGTNSVNQGIPPLVQGVVSTPDTGAPLQKDIRTRIESGLGADLASVRVHSDRGAHGAAQSINAKAFTHKNHIYLGAGQSASDLGLMAHEATHVVQQGAASAPSVQRAADDFRVHGRYTPTSASLRNWVFFERAESALGPHEGRVVSFAATVTSPVTLFGYASEEGSASFNESLIGDRLNEVATVLRREGVTVTDQRRRLPASEGMIDYRRWRAVEMVEGAASAVPDCTLGGSDRRALDVVTEEPVFLARRNTARDMIEEAIDRLNAAEADPAAAQSVADLAHVERLFGSGAPLATIIGNLGAIRDEMMGIDDTRRSFGTECQLSCRTGAIAFYSRSRADYTFC